MTDQKEICPYNFQYAQNIKDKEGTDQLYCKIKECPYKNLEIIKMESIDLEFSKCKTNGLVKKITETFQDLL